MGTIQVYGYYSDSKTWVCVGKSIVGKENDNMFGRAVSLSADGSMIAVGSGSKLTALDSVSVFYGVSHERLSEGRCEK